MATLGIFTVQAPTVEAVNAALKPALIGARSEAEKEKVKLAFQSVREAITTRPSSSSRDPRPR